MEKSFDQGFALGEKAALENPSIVYGIPSIPPFKGRGTANRNAFGYGFVHGFRSIANNRLPQ